MCFMLVCVCETVEIVCLERERESERVRKRESERERVRGWESERVREREWERMCVFDVKERECVCASNMGKCPSRKTETTHNHHFPIASLLERIKEK